MVTSRVALGLLAVAVAWGCDRGQGSQATPSAATPTASAAVTSDGLLDERILSAEQRRVTADVPHEALFSRNVAVRRRAVAALARIADGPAHESLLGALADEEPSIISWAAYGLGFACRGREETTVAALVSRAASLVERDTTTAAPLSDPVAAIADALGRCATQTSEATLRAWLSSDKASAEAAALALGRLAARTRRLDAASVVALLDAASDPERPVEAALLAFSRVGELPEAARARLLEIAKEALEQPGVRRTLAARALGRAGVAAIPVLEALVTDEKRAIGERADAARELAKLGAAGQPAIARRLAAWVEPSALEPRALESAEFAVLLTLLEGLEPPAKEATAALERLESLALPKDATSVAYRRTVQLRCRAASRRAGTASLYPKLNECEPGEQAIERDLALLTVLDRGPLTLARGRRFRELAESPHPRVRQAALQMLAAHPEAVEAHVVLARALTAAESGTVATAAQILSAYPARATPGAGEGDTPAPHKEVAAALMKALELERPADALETRAALINAAGALQLLRSKSIVDVSCSSEHPTLRAAAERALHSMGDRTRRCGSGKSTTAPEELTRLVQGQLVLKLETDAGTLRLELNADVAPVFVTRVRDLVQARFYDGIVFHRVVPGFVVQFGDRIGDGYGGAGKAAVRCETSPIAFDALNVGVALSGRDTGSSQLFVTLSVQPHLDGEYAWLGRAEGPWEKLARGDRLREVRIEP